MTTAEKTEILRRVYHRQIARRGNDRPKLSFEDWLLGQFYKAAGTINVLFLALDDSYDLIRPKKRAHTKKLLYATANYQAVVGEILKKKDIAI